MATKAVSVFPPEPARRERYQNLAPLTSERLLQLAGNAALHVAHVKGGQSLDGDTPNPIPIAPGGTGRGHDHSGGLWGSPLYRSIGTTAVASTGDVYDDIAGTNAFSSSDNPLWWDFDVAPGSTEVLSPRSYISLTVSGTLGAPAFRWPLFVPGCDRGPHGAYNRLYMSLSYVAMATSMSASDTCTLSIKNLHPAFRDLPSPAFTYQLNSGAWSSSPAAYLHVIGDQDRQVPLYPGAVNVIEPKLTFSAVSGGSTRSVRVHIISAEIGVGEVP